MRKLFIALLQATVVSAQTSKAIPPNDAVRIPEFYRLAAQLQNGVWPGWSDAPAPLLLVTQDAELFLTHHPSPPKDFRRSVTSCMPVRVSSPLPSGQPFLRSVRLQSL